MKFLICILFPIFTFAQSDTLRNYNKSLGRRILRGEMLVQGGEAAGLGVLLLLPSSVTKWNEGYMTDAKRNLKRAWSKPPVFDHDDWWINYISHPVAGAYYYNALRSQNATPFQSFLFSAIQSTLWEYGLEAVAEQPSIQDLIVTPLIGSALGEVSHKITLQLSRNGFNTLEKIIVFVINPAFVLNNGYRNTK